MNFSTMDGYFLDKLREDVPTYQFEIFLDNLGVEFSFFLFVCASLMTIPVLYAAPQPMFDGGKYTVDGKKVRRIRSEGGHDSDSATSTSAESTPMHHRNQ